MVDRTDVYGRSDFTSLSLGTSVPREVIETINVKPYGKPLLLIFLQENLDIINKLAKLDKVFYCKPTSINIFTAHSYHLLTYVHPSEVKTFVERLSNVSQVVVAIDGITSSCTSSDNKVRALDGTVISSLDNNIPFKLSFEGKSNDFIVEYLKVFLTIEE